MANFRDQQVEEAAQLARRMRILKWVVIGLGILLVLAMVTTIAGIIYKARHATSTPGASGQIGAGTASPALAGFGQSTIPLPAECQIASASASGDRLIVVTSGPADTCRLILVTDLKSGRLLGQFEFYHQ